MLRFSTFQSVSPSRRYQTSYCSLSSSGSSARQTNVCRLFWNMRRPRAGVDRLETELLDEDDVGGRPSEVPVSKPATSGSPVGYGRWNTTPGGCTVIDSMLGRELRGRY